MILQYTLNFVLVIKIAQMFCRVIAFFHNDCLIIDSKLCVAIKCWDLNTCKICTALWISALKTFQPSPPYGEIVWSYSAKSLWLPYMVYEVNHDKVCLHIGH